MKYTGITMMVFFFVQASFAQDADTTIATFTIRKPEPVKPVGVVYTTGEYPADRGFSDNQDPIINNGPSVMYAFAVPSRSKMILDVEYPAAAIDSGITGLVSVRYEIDERGSPTNLKLEEAAHPLLNEAALSYVRKLPAKSKELIKYVERVRNTGGRVPAYIIPVTFTLLKIGEAEMKKSRKVIITREVCMDEKIARSSGWTAADKLPRLIDLKRPPGGTGKLDVKYAAALIDSGLIGEVGIKYEIDAFGKPANAEVVEGSHVYLEEWAMNFVANLPGKPEDIIKKVMQKSEKGKNTVFMIVIKFGDVG